MHSLMRDFSLFFFQFLCAQLLHDQVGVVVFEPYKPLFMLAFGRGRTALPGMPGGPPLLGHPHRNW